MARLARVVAPSIPHHITRRGNRWQQTSFCEEDDPCYLELMAQFCRPEQVEIGDDSLVRVAPLLQLAPNWRRLLVSVIREEESKVLRGDEYTGRPLRDEAFLAPLEQNLCRIYRRQKPGLKGKHPS
ncbi:MAG: hypothetical protein ACHRXM_05190 [Isosphaerales bacterium]